MTNRKPVNPAAARRAAVARGDMVEARPGETMRLSRDGAEVIGANIRHRIVAYFGPYKNSGLVIEEFDGAEDCREALAGYRNRYSKITFKNVIRREEARNISPTYAKFFPDINLHPELVERMERVKRIEREAIAERRRIKFHLELIWSGKAITAAKISAKADWEAQTGYRYLGSAAVMRPF